MPPASSSHFRALLEPQPNEPAYSLLVISENSLLAVEALKATLDELRQAHATLRGLLDFISAQPSK